MLLDILQHTGHFATMKNYSTANFQNASGAWTEIPLFGIKVGMCRWPLERNRKVEETHDGLSECLWVKHEGFLWADKQSYKVTKNNAISFIKKKKPAFFSWHRWS